MALENILSQEIVQKLGWTLLHFIWQAAAVALLLGILLAVLRKSSANLRYIIACAALGLIVLLPIVTMQLVPVSVPQTTADIKPSPASVIVPVQPNEEALLARAIEYEEPTQLESVNSAPLASWKQRAVERLELTLPYIVSAWLLGVFGLSLWHLGGWAQLQRLRKKMIRQVDDSLCVKLRRLSERLRVKRAVQLVESALVQVPTVVGWLRPVILLPASALTGLTTEQLEALLAHELAHIRRCDYLVNILQTIVETLGFYHPAVWWISHRIRVERENCCDDLAVSISGDLVCYARALTSMEEIRAGRSELAVAATGGNLFGRIRRLLGKDSADTSRASWIPSVITILLIAIIAVPTTIALTTNSEPGEPQQETEKQIDIKPENEEWQDIGEIIPPDFNDTKALTEQINLGSIGQDCEEKVFITCILDATQSNSRRHRFVLVQKNGAVLEPSGYTMLGPGNKLQEKFSFNVPSLTRNIKGFRFQNRPLPLAGIDNTLTQLQEGNFAAVEQETLVPTKLAPPGRYAIELDGVNDYLLVPDSPSLSLEAPFTVEMWIKTELPADASKDYGDWAIISKGFYVGAPRAWVTGFGVVVNRRFPEDPSQLHVEYSTANNSGLFTMPYGISTLTNGKSDWIHLTHVFDGENYKSAPGHPLVMGKYLIPSTRPLMGQIGEIRIWNGARTREQIRRYENVALTGSEPDLAAWWTFEQKEGQFAYDTSGNKNHARLGTSPEADDADPKWIDLEAIPHQTDQKIDSKVKENKRQLNDILEKFSDGTTADKSDNNSKSVRESVENYIAAALAGEDKKAAEYAYPGIAVAAQTKDMQEILQGQDIKIVAACIGEWNSLAISSVIQADHGRTGSTVFHLKKMILDQKVNWLIDDIYLETLDTIGNQISYFLNNVPDAKMIIINPDTYTNKQTDVPVESDNSGEGRQGQTPARNDPILAKSSAPSGVDKSIVRVDLSVVEVPPDSKMDRETIVEIKNLLGDKITIPDSPDAADLLRKAAEATAEVKDESAGDKRVTQQQFDTLVDLLVSRSYVKILMNPTLEVVEGQTAQIKTDQNSLEVTANAVKDDIIYLTVKADLSSQIATEGEGKIPIISRRSFANFVRISSGQSQIIGGMIQPAARFNADGNAKESQTPARELMGIVTASIVAPAGNATQPMETVNFQNAEAKTVIEKLAQWTGKTIIPTDELMKQKISIYSPEEMPRSEAAAMILNSLRSKGYTAEQTDETIFLKPATKEQPGTDKAQIMIETRIMTVSDTFLKDIGLDANSISDPNSWPEPAPFVLSPPDNLGTYSLILDDLNVAFLLKAIQAHKDAKILISPRVTVWDGEKAEMFIGQETDFVSGYSEPNRPSDKPTPRIEKLKTGTSICLKPQLTPDKKNLYLDFESEIRELRGIEERKYKGKYPYQIPQVTVVNIKTSCLIPDGKTLLNGGQKITQEVESVSRVPMLGDIPILGGLFRSNTKTTEPRTLLILVKPSIDPQIKAPPEPQPLDPNDPLINPPEEKLNRADEQK